MTIIQAVKKNKPFRRAAKEGVEPREWMYFWDYQQFWVYQFSKEDLTAEDYEVLQDVAQD